MVKFKKIILIFQNHNKQKIFFSSIFSLVILTVNFYWWHCQIIGILFFVIWLAINSFFLAEFLKHFLDLEKEFEFIFGLFALIFLISLAGAIFIVLYKITPLFVFLILLLVSIISFFLKEIKVSNSFKVLGSRRDVAPITLKKKSIYILFFIFFIIAILLLFQARTGKFILSPWEVISPVYLYVFGLFSFVVLWFIFSKKDWQLVLLLIIFSSFLLRSYLPIVYQTGFGGDRWRHLAAEKWLQEGNVYSPSLFGEKIEWNNFGPIKIPSVLIVGNKTSYAGQWALTNILSWLFTIDVFWIDLLLGFILCSLFIPIFLFKIGQFFSNKKTLPLLLAFLPNLFYPFQVYGAITLPNSFGFLFFIFVFIFWLEYLASQNSKLLLFCVTLTLLMYFNYVLYFILLLEIGLLSWLLKNFSLPREIPQSGNSPSRQIISWGKSKKFAVFLPLIVFGFIFFIPVLDRFSGLSKFISGIFEHPWLITFYFINYLKQLLGVSLIFPDQGFITQGNFIYTQTAKNLSGTTLFSLFSWISLFSILVWTFIVYGFGKFKKLKEPVNKIAFLLSIFLTVSLGNYFIGKYLMSGSVLLSKRSDLFIAFLMIIFLGWGINNFLETRSKFISQTAKIFALCLFLSLFLCSVYGAGPQLQTVTQDELESAKYVWGEIKDEKGNKCVLANTWPLLAMEYVSSRHLITGGFPVYQEYAQPERVQLFNNMALNPSQRYMEKALEITGAEECYFMTEKRWWNKRDKKILERYQKILGDYEQIGDVYIFKFSE
ncbi:MAG: Uncharacterized protein Athens101410_220 [Parcubacteria group bacterium Athens1014_10]|nr:MAG: Uncharacterized protein Athens101410_220 [Parcubacteria group bacterium Athens1014_10]TSD04764.1 MAG: Uncharacterized protein Athens071412_639 [Parcubacteria group bacterium Athens0714_12]